ncbi:hypothetical protein CMI37_01305 [Candidatus Pacearchaeota archaeon]|nr:hypothetical protein [Candidatus Pacearchaeota archaeon]
MNRKIRRDLEKKLGKEATDEMSEKIFQFNKLPEECSACRQQFDKQDKDMVQSWTVVAREETVRLFCPECIRKTQEILNGN